MYPAGNITNTYTVEPLLSGLQFTVPLTGMQFLSTFSMQAELWADSHSYIDSRKENDT
jgi:hypothetical protein